MALDVNSRINQNLQDKKQFGKPHAVFYTNEYALTPDEEAIVEDSRKEAQQEADSFRNKWTAYNAAEGAAIGGVYGGFIGASSSDSVGEGFLNGGIGFLIGAALMAAWNATLGYLSGKTAGQYYVDTVNHEIDSKKGEHPPEPEGKFKRAFSLFGKVAGAMAAVGLVVGAALIAATGVGAVALAIGAGVGLGVGILSGSGAALDSYFLMAGADKMAADKTKTLTDGIERGRTESERGKQHTQSQDRITALEQQVQQQNTQFRDKIKSEGTQANVEFGGP